jgi:hypothetical protein
MLMNNSKVGPEASESPGYLCPYLVHAQVPFRPMVGEHSPLIGHEAQGVVLAYLGSRDQVKRFELLGNVPARIVLTFLGRLHLLGQGQQGLVFFRSRPCRCRSILLSARASSFFLMCGKRSITFCCRRRSMAKYRFAHEVLAAQTVLAFMLMIVGANRAVVHHALVKEQSL